MLDGVTLDQMRVLVAVVDKGGFTAAARHLSRAQSAISHAVANLENQLQLQLFDRSERKPKLTPDGRSILVEARSVIARADRLRARARSLAGGLETMLSLAISAVVPTLAVVAAMERLAERYPTVGLNLRVEEVGGAAVLVRDGVCDLGIVGAPSLTALKPDDVEQTSLGSVSIVAVVASSHPLAQLRRSLDNADLEDHRQLVPTSRAAPRYGNTLVHHTWEVADLPTRHKLLRAGLGWGTLPEHVAHADLVAGRLVRLELSARSQEAMRVPIFAIHRPDQPPGPAGRAIIESLAGTGQPAAQE